MIGALAASGRFLSQYPAASLTLYAANVLLLLLVIALYAVVAPGAGAATWAIVLAGQLYIVGRIGARLAFWASATALFQSRVAHAGYVATPQPSWPDSAMTEGVRR
jgi:hypothetical protein